MLHRFLMATLTTLAVVSGGGSVLGQGTAPAFDVVPASQAAAADPGQEAVRTRDRIARAQIGLKNTGAQPLTVRPDTEWRRLADGSTRPAKWLAPQKGVQPENGVFTIPEKESGTFVAEGDFEAAGTYAIGVTVSAPGSTERRLTFTVTRTVAPVPDTLFVAPKTGRIDLGFSELTSPDARILKVAATNAGNDPIPLGAPTVTRFAAVSGDTESPVGLKSSADASAGSCKSDLGPKVDCAIEISFPAGLSAGRYVADVAISGPGGGRALVSQRIDVRRSAWWAGIVVAVGALAGYLVMLWRESGRTTLDRRIAAAEARAGISRLVGAAKSTVVRQRARELVDKVRTIEGAIAAGTDPAPQLAEVESRYKLLATADQVLAQADSDGTRTMFEALSNRVKAALQFEGWLLDKVIKETARLQSELAALDELHGAATAVKSRLNELDVPIVWLETPSEQPAVDAKRKLAEAFVPIPAAELAEGQTSVLKTRTDALKAANADLNKIPAASVRDLLKQVEAALKPTPAEPAPLTSLKRELEEALKTPDAIDVELAKSLLRKGGQLGLHPPGAARIETVGAEGPKIPPLLPTGSALTLDFNPFLFGIGQAVLPETLRAQRQFWSVVTNAFVLIGIGLTGVMVLWVSNPSWGSEVDIATAFLAGAGTRLAIGSLPAPAVK